MTDRKLSLRSSTDGGANFTEARVIDLGPVGAHVHTLEERRFGRGRQWVFDIEVSSNVRVDILDASWESEVTQ